MFASIAMVVGLSTPFMFVLNGPMDFITSWVAYSRMLPDHIHKLRFSSSIVICVIPRRNWFQFSAVDVRNCKQEFSWVLKNMFKWNRNQ